MSLVATVKNWGLGARSKAKQAAQPTTKKPASKKEPKSVQEVDRLLRRLGPYPIVTGLYDAEDYDALTRRRLDWMAQRKRLLELRHTLGQKTDNDAIQAKATEVLSVDDVRKNASRVRKSEAWRHKQLDSMQQQAEVELEHVIRALLGGPSLTAKYGAMPGGRDPITLSAAMEQAWRDWRAKASARGIIVEAVVDCIAQPKTMADIERERGMASGNGIHNHRRGLDIWAEVRGWITIRLTERGE